MTLALGLVADILLFLAVVVVDAFGLVPITQTLFLVPLIWILLRLRGQQWASIGFRRPESYGRAIALGVVAGLALLVTTPILARLSGTEPDISGLAEIRGSLPLLFLFLAPSSWLAGATWPSPSSPTASPTPLRSS